MRKLLAVLFIFLLLLTSCSGGKTAAYIDEEPEQVLSAVYNAVAETETIKNVKTMLMTENLSADNENYYLGVSGVKYVSAVASEPEIQPSPYSFVIVKLQNGVDYDGQRQLIEQNLNKSKWVCTSSEEALAVRYENFVAVIMCDKETANALEAAYLSVMEAYKNGSI